MQSLLVRWAARAEPLKRSIRSWKQNSRFQQQFSFLFFQQNLDTSNIEWTTAILIFFPPSLSTLMLVGGWKAMEV